jgi:hypothetical protein
MTDQERVDAFLARLQADPDLAAIAVMLGPYKAMIRNPTTIVIVLDSLVDHWQATAPTEITQ